MTVKSKADTLKERQDRRFINKETQTAAKYLRRLEELSNAPDGIEQFYQVLKNIYVEMGHTETGNQKTVGTYCVMTPPTLRMRITC